MTDKQQSLEFDREAVDADLRTLAELGQRSIGSASEAQAREFVEQALSASGLGVRRHGFPCVAWSLEGEPSVRIGAEGWAADVVAFTYSPPTPDGGISGVLERVGQHWVSGLYRWEKFRIADDSGSTVGYLSAPLDGPPVPAALAESSSPLPHFIIGGDDLARVRAELAQPGSVPFWGRIDARVDRNATGVNLRASIPGTAATSLPIALCAHLDTMAKSPRAAGATRALLAVLSLARHYARHPAPNSIDVIIFTGTEADIAGSKAYVADHPEALDLTLAINVDEIPEREALLVASVPEAFEAQLYKLVESMDPGAPREYRSPLPPGSDHMPFATVGLPVLLLGRGTSPARVAPGRQVDPVEAIWEVAEIVREVIDVLAATVATAGSKRKLLAPHRDTQWEHAMSLKQY